MAYELTDSGAHRMTCDTPGCEHYCLSPGEDELREDLTLAGWSPVGEDKGGNKLFQCPGCSQGTHPAQAALNAATGGTGVIHVEAPMGVNKGDPFYSPTGDLIGHYTDDAQQGDEVGVKVQLPEPPAPTSAVELYDDMLEGSDDDDDQHGRVSAVAPGSSGGAVHIRTAASTDPERGVTQCTASPGAQYGGEPAAEGPMEKDTVVHSERGSAPTPRSLDSPPGQTGGGGIVRAAKRPDLTSAEAKARLRGAPSAARGPRLNTAALAKTASIFDNLDPSESDWDPDA